MANGTTKREIAQADRMRERQEQDQKATRNALDALRRAAPGTQPYREEMDSVSEVTAGTNGFSAKGIPKEGWKVISWGFAIGIILIAAAIVVIAWRGLS